MSTLSNSIDFGKKTIVLVTGASRGIGREIAVRVSHELCAGSIVALIARSNDDLLQTKALMKQDQPIQILHYVLDLTQPSLADYEKVIGECKAAAADVHNAVIFHNAGSLGTVDNLVTLTDRNAWDAYCNLNISSMGMLNAVFMRMLAEKKLYNINITSLIGSMPVKSAGMYGLGKAARNYYFKVLALEEPQMVVLNYSPGPVDTDMFQTCSTLVKDEKVKASFDRLKANKTVLTTEQTVSKLLRLLKKGDFTSGDIVDYFDYE